MLFLFLGADSSLYTVYFLYARSIQDGVSVVAPFLFCCGTFSILEVLVTQKTSYSGRLPSTARLEQALHNKKKCSIALQFIE